MSLTISRIIVNMSSLELYMSCLTIIREFAFEGVIDCEKDMKRLLEGEWERDGF